MASDAYIAAAKKEIRIPVVHLAIETIDALREVVANQADWEASQGLTRISTTTEPGKAKIAAQSQSAGVSGSATASEAMFVTGIRGTLRFSWMEDCVSWVSVAVPVGSKTALVSLNLNTCTVFDPITLDLNVLLEIAAPFEQFSASDIITIGDPYFVSISASGAAQMPGAVTVAWDGATERTLHYMPANASLRTMILDLGAVPTVASVFGAADRVPAGTTLAYTARGRNDPADAWASLGWVSDGDELTAYRYYDVSAAFSTNTGESPELSEISITGGDTRQRHYSTHLDAPVQGAKPYLKEKSLSSLTSKIELDKLSTVGQVSAKLHWRRDSGDLIATGFLKNRRVSIQTGFLGLAEKDFEPYFTGLFHDWSSDPLAMEIEITLQDVLKRFFKEKIPRGSFNAVGAKTHTALTWLNENVIQVMLDIFDAMDLPGRLMDRVAFETLRDGDFSSADWQVSRTIEEPTEAKTLLEELSILSGVFIVPLPSGKLTPVRYDPEAANAAVLDALEHQQQEIEGGQEELFTRNVCYYNPIAADPSDDPADYNKGYMIENAAAASNWGEKGEKTYFDKWEASAAAMVALAERRDAWYANPLLRTSLKQLPPRWQGLLPGQVIRVQNLLLPSGALSWDRRADIPLRTSKKRFLIISKKTHPLDATFDLDLMEVRSDRLATDFSADTVGQIPSAWTERWDASGDFLVQELPLGYPAGPSYLQGSIPDAGDYLISADDFDHVQDGEILLKFQTPTEAEQRIVAARCSGAAGNETGYYIAITYSPFLGRNLRMHALVDGVQKSVYTGPYNWTDATWHWMRFRVAGRMVYVRMWPDGDSEPTVWTSAAETDLVPSGLWWGIAGSQSDINVDYISMAADSLTAAGP